MRSQLSALRQIRLFFIICALILIMGGILPFSCVKTMATDEASMNMEEIILPVDQSFDLGNKTRKLTYRFSFWLGQVSEYARITVRGGIITGPTPQRLELVAVLDGQESSRVFERSLGYKTEYTFHPDSEYTLLLRKPPTHPNIPGLQTLHNITLTLIFSFSSISDGLGKIQEIRFDTFTPEPLKLGQKSFITPLRERGTWKITPYSFGSYTFITSLILPELDQLDLSMTFNISLIFTGLDLDSWKIIIKSGNSTDEARDTLQAFLSLSTPPFEQPELQIIIDPPKVSTDQIVDLDVKIYGQFNEISNSQDLNEEINDYTMKSVYEGLWLFQGIIIIAPLLVYYRKRQRSLGEEKKRIRGRK
ncbi:MAG: hypothetical protein ACFE9L_12865 [Candidatus Hodarchaeota archaeon]